MLCTAPEDSGVVKGFMLLADQCQMERPMDPWTSNDHSTAEMFYNKQSGY